MGMIDYVSLLGNIAGASGSAVVRGVKELHQPVAKAGIGTSINENRLQVVVLLITPGTRTVMFGRFKFVDLSVHSHYDQFQIDQVRILCPRMK